MVEQETEEGRKPIGIFVPATPTEQEVKEHELTHTPYRGWCKHCVAGKAITTPHRACVGNAREMIVPVVSIDYMFLGNKGEEKGSPILAGIDAKSGTMFAQLVPEKGVHSYAVKRLSQEIKRMGYTKIILKSDQEPAIVALKNAVRNLKESEIIPEESPAYEHQSNGTIESAINRIEAGPHVEECIGREVCSQS